MPDESYQTIPVTINSSDSSIRKLQTKVEKCALMHLWLAKAVALLDSYNGISDSLYKEQDSVKRGQRMQDLESHFMSAVSFFLRCYMDQPSFHLNINDVTPDPDMRNCYKNLRALRDDEFVHWKGLRSQLTVRYSFTALTADQCQVGNPIHCEYQDKIGPDGDLSVLRNLFSTTDRYVEDAKNKTLAHLSKRLFSDEGFRKSQIVNAQGEQIFKTK